jgi:hypothetical protein
MSIQQTLAMLSLLATGSAMAGPDFFVIEQARKAHAQRTDAAAASSTGVEVHKPALPLDHGPRAQTTPYLNAKRKV